MSNTTFKDNHEMKLYQKALKQAEKNVSDLEAKIHKLDRRLSLEAFQSKVPENARTVVWQTLKGDGAALIEKTYASREEAIEKAFKWIYDGSMVHYGNSIRLDENGAWHDTLGDCRHILLFVKE